MVEEKEGYIIVTPGVLLATSEKSGEGIFTLNGKTFSKYFGILKKSRDRIEVIPFQQSYKPKIGDKVIGIVKEFVYPFFIVDLLSATPAYLYLSNISEYPMRQNKATRIYTPETLIFSEVVEISDRVKLSMKGRESKILRNGRITYITPAKVPRVIGKGGSMIKMIMDKTKCKLIVGQNGIIWIEGNKLNLIIKIIKKIDEESHISGLTDRISKLIDKEMEE
jgi:exosome complex component RRP4